MKQGAIKVGDTYTDGKKGSRRVLAISGGKLREVRYLLLSARATVQYDWKTGSARSLIGEEFTCSLSSFAQWAREST